MKDGSSLERMAAITTAAFDKTGTLTTGEPAVSSNSIPQGEESSLARALAMRSVHPAARALASALRGSHLEQVNDLHEVPGFGVEALSGRRRLRLGRASWVAEIAMTSLQAPRQTNVAFAVENGPMRFATLSERLREWAPELVQSLRARQVESFIMSGDGAAQVQAVAKACSIAEAHATLRPGDKLALLQEKAGHGDLVLMVGDGLNDAPALAAAHVSMAPSSASDVGRMAADFVFTRDSLSAVSFAHRVAVKTGRIVKENFALAIFYNVLAVPLAMTGHLNPLIAAVAMSTSSIVVVANSLRLQLLQLDAPAPVQKPAPLAMAHAS